MFKRTLSLILCAVLPGRIRRCRGPHRDHRRHERHAHRLACIRG